MSPKITVAIPFYNTESYIEHCLDSVVSQTFADLEILCIDDGSTDKSGSIADRYASSNHKIKVVHLAENHGVPYARNLAIDMASSEYIYFMDSDDWIDTDYLDAMYHHAVLTGQDVVINGNWYVEYDDPSKRTCSGRFGFVGEEPAYYSPATVQSLFFPVVWPRLYRVEYLRKNNIRSPLLEGGVEDNYFTSLAEILQERSYIFNGPFYHYYQRSGSLSRHPDKQLNHFRNFKVFTDELHKRGIPADKARRFYVMEDIVIYDENMFDFIKAFFSDVEADVMECPELYSVFDAFVLRSVLSCHDYTAFKKMFCPRMSVSFFNRLRTRHSPTLQSILDGSWENDRR